MRPLFWCGLTALVLSGPLAGAQKTEWKEFTWKDGKCSVLLPGTPTEKKGQLQVLASPTLYMVHYHDREEFAKAEKDAEVRKKMIKESMDLTRDSLVKTLKGKLLADQDIKLAEHPGREVRIEVETLGMYRLRMYQVGPRFYQLIVVGASDAATTKDAEKFFNSFKLVK